MKRSLCHLLIVSLFLLASGNALAVDKQKAKEHFRAGNSLTRLEDFSAAATAFEQSLAHYPTKAALFNLAECYRALHRYEDAITAYERLQVDYAGRLSESMAQAVADNLAALRNVVAELEIGVEQPDAEIVVDGQSVGSSPLTKNQIVAPGTHTVQITKEGYQPVVIQVRLVPRQREVVHISLEPEEEAPDHLGTVRATDPVQEESAPELLAEPKSERKLSALFWTGASATVVSGVLAGVFWGKWSPADKKYDEKYELWEQDQNNPDLTKAVDDAAGDATRYNRTAVAMTAAFGLFAVGTAIVMALDLNRDQDEQLTFYPGGATYRF